MNLNLHKFSKLSLILVIGAVGFSSCGDDDDSGTAPDNRNKTQLLTDANWKTASLMYDSTGTTSDMDLFAGADACDKDDQHNFDAASTTAVNGTYVWTEGATKCDPTNPDTVATGVWMFMNTAQNQITLPEPLTGQPVQWEIVELNGSSMKLKFTQSASESWTWSLVH